MAAGRGADWINVRGQREHQNLALNRIIGPNSKDHAGSESRNGGCSDKKLKRIGEWGWDVGRESVRERTTIML